MLTLALGLRQGSSLKAWYMFQNVFKRQQQLVMNTCHKERDAVYFLKTLHVFLHTFLLLTTNLLNLKMFLTDVLAGFLSLLVCHFCVLIWSLLFMKAHLNFQMHKE